MLRPLTALLFFMSTLLVCWTASACPCGLTPRDDVERASDVFRGKLVALKGTWRASIPEAMVFHVPASVRPDNRCRADFEVTAVIKGDRNAKRTVWFEAPYGDCSDLAKLGDEHLVLTEDRQRQSWFLTTCGTSGRTADRTLVLDEIGWGSPPDPPRRRALGLWIACGAALLAGAFVLAWLARWCAATARV
jgi:hypothetical protein